MAFRLDLSTFNSVHVVRAFSALVKFGLAKVLTSSFSRSYWH